MSFTAVASSLNPTAWFRLNEGVASTKVSGGMGITGAVPGTGVTLGVSGLIGTSDTAASFDGTNSITVTGLPSLGSAFWFFCMFQIAGSLTTTYQLFAHYIDANNYVHVFLDANDDIEIRAVIDSVTYSARRSGVTLTAGINALAISVGPSGRYIWLNGSESASDTTATIGTATVAARIGARNNDILIFEGTLDEVLLGYGTELTDAQATLLYNAAVGNGGPNSHYYLASQEAAA